MGQHVTSPLVGAHTADLTNYQWGISDGVTGNYFLMFDHWLRVDYIAEIFDGSLILTFFISSLILVGCLDLTSEWFSFLTKTPKEN